MSVKEDVVRFIYNKKKDKFEHVPVPKECHNCIFATITWRIDDINSFGYCQIDNEIEEGTKACPHEVYERLPK